MDTDITQKAVPVKDIPKSEKSATETPIPPLLPGRKTSIPPLSGKKEMRDTRSQFSSKRAVEEAQMVQDQCQQLCLSVFFREHAPVSSLGFTSAIGGEGKSFLAMVTSKVLANDSSNPVTLLECNWDHPSLYESFGCPQAPGLAEWLRGECSETDIRHQVSSNLTFIPAGKGEQDAVKLLQQMRQKDLLDALRHTNDLLIVDLPAIVSTVYAPLAASLVESLIFIVRAGVTPDAVIAEAFTQIKDLPVQGVVLNQVKSQVPHWIRKVL